MRRKLPSGRSKKVLSEPRQVYALVDPRDDTIRHVGLSKNAQFRLQQHLWGYCGSKQSRLWIENLQHLGMSPTLLVLEEIDVGPDTYQLAHERELYWIREMLGAGEPLLNVFGVTRPYSTDDITQFRIDVARLSRPELSALSGVSVSSIKRAEEGQKVDRLTQSRILAGLSQHLGRTITRDDIDEFAED